ncbi:CBS domain-containing protein [Nocardia sp. NPDC059177]|uniref:CBS domain-containing protein n=1 Tax=Nocardia sp. NPDC059177 TaxID=3346759 RepID=UPI00367D4B6C
MTLAITQEQIADLSGRTIPVKELVDLFGFRRRDYESVQAITVGLHTANLTTAPSFATCHRDTAVTIVPVQEADSAEETAAYEDFRPGSLPQRPFQIGDLPSAVNGIHSVTPDATLSYAIHLMRQHDFSQIPVIGGSSDLKGIITWQSVAAMREKQGFSGKLTDAMIETVECAETHHELFSRMTIIHKHGYMLVRKPSGRFSGIVTPADIAERFHQLGLPFFLVGEIEGKLRTLLRPLPQTSIDLVLNPRQQQPPGTSIDELMFGQYVNLLRQSDVPATKQKARDKQLTASADLNWQTLGWETVDRQLFVTQLVRVKDIRNRIAHFSPKLLPDSDITELRSFCSLLDHLM